MKKAFRLNGIANQKHAPQASGIVSLASFTPCKFPEESPSGTKTKLFLISDPRIRFEEKQLIRRTELFCGLDRGTRFLIRYNKVVSFLLISLSIASRWWQCEKKQLLIQYCRHFHVSSSIFNGRGIRVSLLKPVNQY